MCRKSEVAKRLSRRHLAETARTLLAAYPSSQDVERCRELKLRMDEGGVIVPSYLASFRGLASR